MILVILQCWLKTLKYEWNFTSYRATVIDCLDILIKYGLTIVQNNELWTRSMAQVLECLPSKHKTLSSNPSIRKSCEVYLKVFQSKIFCWKVSNKYWVWWLTPLIPGTQEAETGRI
jgi:hypothetical protein